MPQELKGAQYGWEGEGTVGKPQEDLSFQTKHGFVKPSDVLCHQPKTNGKL